MPIIALAVSAGGVQALSMLLSALPADFPAPILIAQHLSPGPPSRLASLLNRHSALRVQEARQGEHVLAGHVYIAPCGTHLEVCLDETLLLSAAPRVGLGRPSADRLFRSLAAAVGRRAIAVVLTGLGRDGSRGVRAIKASGGTTLAQDAQCSQFAGMPQSAAETGCVDFVLPLAEIPQKLITVTRDLTEAAALKNRPVPGSEY